MKHKKSNWKQTKQKDVLGYTVPNVYSETSLQIVDENDPLTKNSMEILNAGNQNKVHLILFVFLR